MFAEKTPDQIILSENYYNKAEELYDDQAQQAIKLYLSSASLGRCKSMSRLSKIYKEGWGYQQPDAIKSDFWDQMAFSLKNRTAPCLNILGLNLLGYNHYRGLSPYNAIDIRINKKKAELYFMWSVAIGSQIVNRSIIDTGPLHHLGILFKEEFTNSESIAFIPSVQNDINAKITKFIDQRFADDFMKPLQSNQPISLQNFKDFKKEIKQLTENELNKIYEQNSELIGPVVPAEKN